ncbi:hypothetical protein CBOM_03193 [Ceraceosorus bombacis]|uniref:TM7S3/TM198-like domain-containing protein n=1 Tax=Ceraceosorus bombacis TaxID=401625 RepID=A0A0P1BLA8_9BASI|nr:hypothetical protein CBOM_03193 [Ceraceosorus bombacis]
MRVTAYGCLWLRHGIPGAGVILPLILLVAVQARPQPQREPLPTSSPSGDPGPSSSPRPTGAPSTGSVWATYTIYTTTLSPSSTASTSAPTPSSTADGDAGMAASSDDLPLNTRIDAAFGVLGVVMIITGGALAVRASRSRWILYSVSATILMLGVDCYTTAGLKEFYARNLLGDQLFADRHRPTFEHGQFPLPQAVQIELGVIGGCTLMSLALQSKMFAELRANLRALKSDDEDRRINAQARRASQHIFRNAQRDLVEWERRHGYRTDDPELGSQGTPTEEKASDNRSHFTHGSFTRNNSGQSLSPIPEIGDESVQRSIFYGATAPARSNSHVSFADSVKGLSRNENIGRSDTMYASNGVRFPTAVAAANPTRGDPPPARSADLQERQRLLDEIANIRQSISSLHSTLPAGNPLSAPQETLSATGSSHAPLRGDAVEGGFGPDVT